MPITRLFTSCVAVAWTCVVPLALVCASVMCALVLLVTEATVTAAPAAAPPLTAAAPARMPGCPPPERPIYTWSCAVTAMSPPAVKLVVLRTNASLVLSMRLLNTVPASATPSLAPAAMPTASRPSLLEVLTSTDPAACTLAPST